MTRTGKIWMTLDIRPLIDAAHIRLVFERVRSDKGRLSIPPE